MLSKPVARRFCDFNNVLYSAASRGDRNRPSRNIDPETVELFAYGRGNVVDRFRYKALMNFEKFQSQAGGPNIVPLCNHDP